MARALLNTIDSEALGARVLDIIDWESGDDPEAFEASAILPLAPRFAFCKLPAEQLEAIHRLQRCGFAFAEFQLSTELRIRRRPEPHAFPYHFEPAVSQADQDAVLGLAGSIFSHDRFSNDPGIGPALAGRRYQAYVRKSFAAPDERVFAMKNDATGEVVSFATLRLPTPETARLLIGGVANPYKASGLGAIHDLVGLQHYFDLGIRRLESAVSGINYPIINLEVGHLGFKVRQAHVVLRKAYSPAHE